MSGIYNNDVTATTGGASGATVLSAPYNTVTTTPVNGGVVLSANSGAGMKIKISNIGTNTLTVYPPPGCTINGLSSTTMPRGSTWEFICIEGDTEWHIFKDVNVSILGSVFSILGF